MCWYPNTTALVYKYYCFNTQTILYWYPKTTLLVSKNYFTGIQALHECTGIQTPYTGIQTPKYWYPNTTCTGIQTLLYWYTNTNVLIPPMKFPNSQNYV